MLIPVINIIYQRFLTHRVNVYLAGEVGLEPTTICLTDKRAAIALLPIMVRAAGVEPATYGLEVRCSDPLSYAP